MLFKRTKDILTVIIIEIGKIVFLLIIPAILVAITICNFTNYKHAFYLLNDSKKKYKEMLKMTNDQDTDMPEKVIKLCQAPYQQIGVGG